MMSMEPARVVVLSIPVPYLHWPAPSLLIPNAFVHHHKADSSFRSAARLCGADTGGPAKSITMVMYMPTTSRSKL